MAGVARGGLLVGVQLGLHLGEDLLADNRRDRHRDPVLLRPRGMALARPGREQSRPAAAGRHHLGTVGQRPTGIGRVAQDAAHAGRGPARLAGRGYHSQPGQPLSHLVHGGLRLQVPVEQLRDQHRLARLHPDRGRITGPLGVQPVPERRAGPRQQRARLQLGLPPAAHPLSNQRALVLRDRSADLQQQLVVRIGAHRPVQELHLAAVTGQLIDQQHLVDIVAGQPVRRGDQDQVQLGQRRMVSQPIQARAAQAGAAIAVIAVDMLLLQRPAAPGNRLAQPVKLLLDGLRLGLAGGRHPRIHRRSHQAPPRRSAPDPAPPPSAPAAGRPDPTGARRRDADSAAGTRSRCGSSGSPIRATSLQRADPRKRSGRCHQLNLSSTALTQQNLSFVIRPSKASTATPKTPPTRPWPSPAAAASAASPPAPCSPRCC